MDLYNGLVSASEFLIHEKNTYYIWSVNITNNYYEEEMIYVILKYKQKLYYIKKYFA